jgi:hypothetical protein
MSEKKAKDQTRGNESPERCSCGYRWRKVPLKSSVLSAQKKPKERRKKKKLYAKRSDST